ncbi:MAG: hypothetical protein ACM3VW_07615 [Bacteroidota bacterium]
MKPLGLWLITLLAAVLPTAAPAATIADGTPIVLQLTQPLRSGGPKVGDRVPLIVRDTVYLASGSILVANGASASGTVTRSKGTKRLLREGELDFVVDSVSAVDGTRLSVRGLQSKSGKEVGITARVAISFLFKPLMLLKGKDIVFPAGLQFPTYVDGDQQVPAPLPPGKPQPLIVRDIVSMLASEDTVLYSFTLANPNRDQGLLNAALVTTVYNANGEPIGSNASLNPDEPQQVIYALRPGETRNFVKRVGFKGGYARTDIHVAQPWAKWDERANLQSDVRVLNSDWKDPRTITGMVRNEGPVSLRNVQIMVTASTGGQITALGLASIDLLDAGQNQEFRAEITGQTAPGGKYEISAYGQSAPR